VTENFLEPLAIDGFQSAFIGRIADVEVDADRDATIARLLPFHEREIGKLGFSLEKTWRAEQVHGGGIAVVRESLGSMVSGVDGLITNVPGVLLAIYVADCGAVYLIDEKNKAIGLVHSGKKGTDAEITRVALEKMAEEYGTQPADVIAVLAPCIRPPAYDVDFAADIKRTLECAGVEKYYDCGICTSSNLKKYYSYRIEKGATGRMLALLGIEA
jgi:YfiH family protein